jgi:oxygen-independent coproporphyrinogen-3 oxidase
MKIKVTGTSDRKTLLAIKTLLNTFHVTNQLVEDDEDVLFDIVSIETTNLIIVNVTHQDQLFSNSQPILDENPKTILKYTILGAIYKALCHLSQKGLKWGLLSGIRPTKLVHKMLKNSYTPEEIRQRLTNYYFLSPDKAREICDVVNYQLAHIPNLKGLEKEISIYINIPFCLSRCTYCSFTSYLSEYSPISPKVYLEHLILEIDALAKFIEDNRVKVTTVYIGGGTPTALSIDELSRLLQAVTRLTKHQLIQEFTLEAGRPDSLDQDKLELIRGSEVTRISINPQTFNEETLKRVNRHHSNEAIFKIYQLASRLKIKDINMDLIVGLPGEGHKDVMDSIDKTISLSPTSITVHSLALKRGSKLIEQTDFNQIDDDFNQSFAYIQERLKENGYKPYYLYRQKHIVGELENVGYCKPGYLSLYNVLMIEEKQTIIGLGCGSSSKFLDYDIILNPKDLKTYCESHSLYLERKLDKLKQWVKEWL